MGHSALAELSADLHGPDVPNEHRPLADLGHNHLLDVFRVGDEPEASDDVLLSAVLQVVAAGDAVVGRNGIDHVLERETVGPQSPGCDVHVVLAYEPAEGRDFGDSLDGFQLRRNEPVLDLAKLTQTVPIAPDYVLVDLTQGR